MLALVFPIPNVASPNRPTAAMLLAKPRPPSPTKPRHSSPSTQPNSPNTQGWMGLQQCYATSPQLGPLPPGGRGEVYRSGQSHSHHILSIGNPGQQTVCVGELEYVSGQGKE